MLLPLCTAAADDDDYDDDEFDDNYDVVDHDAIYVAAVVSPPAIISVCVDSVATRDIGLTMGYCCHKSCS